MSEITATSAGAARADASSRYIVREHHPENGTHLGYWMYLMSDCLIFACLFAAYGVLGREYAGGPTAQEVLELPAVAVNTSLLLLSSITYGFAVLEMQRDRRNPMLVWLVITGLLGAACYWRATKTLKGDLIRGSLPSVA